MASVGHPRLGLRWGPRSSFLSRHPSSVPTPCRSGRDRRVCYPSPFPPSPLVAELLCHGPFVGPLGRALPLLAFLPRSSCLPLLLRPWVFVAYPLEAPA